MWLCSSKSRMYEVQACSLRRWHLYVRGAFCSYGYMLLMVGDGRACPARALVIPDFNLCKIWFKTIDKQQRAY